MLAPREIDEYLLPTERRVIRVRMHWAVMAKNLISTGLFLLLMICGAAATSPTGALVDNLTFYLVAGRGRCGSPCRPSCGGSSGS